MVSSKICDEEAAEREGGWVGGSQCASGLPPRGYFLSASKSINELLVASVPILSSAG